MKYVSPQTEKRKQRQRKRRKQIMLCVALLCLIAVVTTLILVFKGGKDKPSSSELPNSDSAVTDITSSETDESSSSEEDVSSENEDSSSEEVSSKDDSSSSEDKDESKDDSENKKPKKKKQSLISRIKAIFAKTEPIPVIYPAISFGRTIDAQMDEIVSLSPLATEIILSSPSQNALVAVSNYCNKRGNDDLMTVGTPLIPDVNKIIQLQPDCLIVQTPLSDIDKKKFEENGILVLQLDYPKTLEDLKEIYRSVTAITLGADIATFESERVLADITEKLNLYSLALDGQNKLNAVMLFNSYGMIATADTIEGQLLEYFFDVKDMGSGYMAESMDAVVATNPEVLIVSDDISSEQLVQIGLGDTSAVANDRVYYVDIQQFENLSLKTIKTLSGIANEVYGDIIQPPVVETEE